MKDTSCALEIIFYILRQYISDSTTHYCKLLHYLYFVFVFRILVHCPDTHCIVLATQRLLHIVNRRHYYYVNFQQIQAVFDNKNKLISKLVARETNVTRDPHLRFFTT